MQRLKYFYTICYEVFIWGTFSSLCPPPPPHTPPPFYMCTTAAGYIRFQHLTFRRKLIDADVIYTYSGNLLNDTILILLK